jgi:hypothetical protein
MTMNTVAQLPEVDVVVSNIYLQQEVELAQQIIAALADSEELPGAIAIWEKSTEVLARNKKELEGMRARRGEITAEIEAIKGNFGAEDSFSDLKKIEALQSELATIAELEPILDGKLWYESPLNREIRDNAARVTAIVDTEFSKIRLQLKENLDYKINDLKQTVASYQAATKRASAEQQVMPGKLLSLQSIRKIVPPCEGLEKLVASLPMMIAGATQRGINIAKNQPAPAQEAAPAPAPQLFYPNRAAAQPAAAPERQGRIVRQRLSDGSTSLVYSYR